MEQLPVPATQAREIGRFIVTLLLLLSPALFLYGGLEALAWKTGESMPMNRVAKWQDQGSGREWRGGDGRSYLTYKLARIKRVKPEILFLGSSRGNSFRAEDFAPYRYYNAALCGWTFSHYLRFLQLVTQDGYAPKVLIFNLDYWMFSADYDKYWKDRFYEKPETHWAALKMVLDHTWESIDWPWSPKTRPAVFPGQPDPNVKVWDRLGETDHLRGLFAVLSGNGIRADGSLLDLRNFKPDPERLEKDGITVGVAPPEGGEMASNQIEAFEQFTAFAKSKHILLIGVQTPMAGRLIYGLNRYPDNGIWREVRGAARQKYFADHGVLFLDFVDLPEYRDHTEMFLDSVHPNVPIITDVAYRVRTDPRVNAVFRKAQLTAQPQVAP